MSDQEENNGPIVHDPAREAVSALRGYTYQILQSVLAWLGLRDGETLFLEGAEDFDRIEGTAAEATQVRDTTGSGTVTMRTASVVEAISHFWEHRLRNRDRKVSFRYLTTSSVGIEQGAPFGVGIGGIDIWRKAQQTDDLVERTRCVRELADFLLQDGRVSATIRQFLINHSNEEIFTELIAPIQWLTNAPPSDGVRHQIETKLVALGDTRSVAAPDAKKALGALVTEALRVATRDHNRALDRVALVEIFDEDTRISVPQGQYLELVQAAMIAGVAPADIGPPAASEATTIPVVRDLPPVPGWHHARPILLGTLDTALRSQPFCVLLGSTGTGKTTTAAAVARQSGRTSKWVDLRVNQSERGLNVTIYRLEAAYNYIARASGPIDLVLDDLDVAGDMRLLEGVLARISSVQRSRGAKLMITAAQELPQRLRRILGVDDASTFRVPAFSRLDIANFLAERGCADLELAQRWAGPIWFTTSGHPQLVHARVAALEIAGFPEPTSRDIVVTPHEISDARLEARKLISDLEPAARELLYRLSLTTHAFNREFALTIAAALPALAEPGNAFDRLVGPWIESIGSDLYRISPLVRSAGAEVYGESWAKEMHRLIAHILLRPRTLLPLQVSAALAHALIAKDDAVFVRLVVGLARAETAAWRALGEAASWFLYVATERGMSLPLEHVGTKFFIRILQYRMATAIDDDVAHSIVARLDEEIPSGTTDNRTRLARHMFLTQMLVNIEARWPLPDLVLRCVEHMRLTEELGEVLAQPGDEAAGEFSGPRGRAEMTAHMLVPRVHTPTELSALLDTLQGLSLADRQLILEPISQKEIVARVLFDRPWMVVFKSTHPDWPGFRALVERAYAMAREAGVRGIAEVAAKAIARIVDEDVGAPREALEIAERHVREIGDSPSLQDGRAKIHYRLGETERALQLWSEALPVWQVDGFDIAPSLSYREAACAAAVLGRWSEAARFFRRGADRDMTGDRPTVKAGFLIDAGFVEWKGGQYRAAVGDFDSGLRLLEPLQNEAGTDPLYSVQKRAAQMLKWLAASTEGRLATDVPEPPIGWCSLSDPLPESDRPRQAPLDFLFSELLRLEHFSEAGEALWQRHSSKLKDSRFGIVRRQVTELEILRRFRVLDMEKFPIVAAEYIDACLICHEYYRLGGLSADQPLPADAVPGTGPEHLEHTRRLLLMAAMVLVARDRLTLSVIAGWRAAIVQRGITSELDPWMTVLEGLFISCTVDPDSLLYGPGQDWTLQQLASVRVATTDDTSPEMMLTCHALWLRGIGTLSIRDWIASDIAAVIESAWRKLAQRPFLLVAPATSVPALLAACDAPEVGWTKVRGILLAALDASGVPADSWVRAAIQQFSP